MKRAEQQSLIGIDIYPKSFLQPNYHFHHSETYRTAVDMLSSIHLALYFSNRSPIRTPLQNTIALYWALSDRQLVTLRDLFRFIIHLLHQTQKMSKPSTYKRMDLTSNVLCVWTKDDLDRAEAAMLKVLRVVQTGQWVSWRALRGAASKAVDSQELLDYSLRELGGKQLDDGHFVAVRCNAETSAIEYRSVLFPSLLIPELCLVVFLTIIS
jgi:hypothetical protein